LWLKSQVPVSITVVVVPAAPCNHKVTLPTVGVSIAHTKDLIPKELQFDPPREVTPVSTVDNIDPVEREYWLTIILPEVSSS
jgi:hypothetical protein